MQNPRQLLDFYPYSYYILWLQFFLYNFVAYRAFTEKHYNNVFASFLIAIRSEKYCERPVKLFYLNETVLFKPRLGRHSKRQKYFHGKRQTVGCFIPAETSMRMRQRGQGVLPRIVRTGETRSYDPR